MKSILKKLAVLLLLSLLFVIVSCSDIGLDTTTDPALVGTWLYTSPYDSTLYSNVVFSENNTVTWTGTQGLGFDPKTYRLNYGSVFIYNEDGSMVQSFYYWIDGNELELISGYNRLLFEKQ